VLTHMPHEGITHIQYTDDTILMVEDDDMSILNMKFILYCFEWLFGLKINYHKSETFIFGFIEMEKTRIANMLNCHLGVLPIKYLGINISNSKMGKVAFIESMEGEEFILRGETDSHKQLPICQFTLWDFTYYP
jgi:hypothetical protein